MSEKNIEKENRLSRVDFFLGTLLMFAIVTLPAMALTVAMAARYSNYIIYPLAILFLFSLLVFIYFQISLIVRRGHDIGWSGLLSFFVVILGSFLVIPTLILYLIKGENGINKYGVRHTGTFIERIGGFKKSTLGKFLVVKLPREGVFLRLIKNNVLIAVGLMIFGFTFYWFEYRPMQIKAECSYIQVRSADIPAFAGVSEQEAMEKNQQIKDECSSKKDKTPLDQLGCDSIISTQPPRAGVQGEVYTREATVDEYNLCLIRRNSID